LLATIQAGTHLCFLSFITTCFNKKAGDAPPGTRKKKERDPLLMTEMGLLKLDRDQHHYA
jgi:hypothetical protein